MFPELRQSRAEPTAPGAEHGRTPGLAPCHSCATESGDERRPSANQIEGPQPPLLVSPFLLFPLPAALLRTLSDNFLPSYSQVRPQQRSAGAARPHNPIQEASTGNFNPRAPPVKAASAQTPPGA